MANIAQLVVLSCYYNPCGYATRWQNYNRFKSALKESGVTLLTLECAFGNQAFELPDALDTLKLTSSQSPKGDWIPTPLQSGVSLNRTAMSGRSRFRGLIHCKLGFTLLRFSGFRLA